MDWSGTSNCIEAKFIYEQLHFESVQRHLRYGMLAYDIGAYNGETSILVAQAVGPENVVIIEPAEVNWPSIEERWYHEVKTLPRATFPGFLDAHDKHASELCLRSRMFPPESWNPAVPEDKLEFRWLHYRATDPNVEARPRLSLDTMASIIGYPDGFTMDVEGAELLVLQGAKNTLVTRRPMVWVSIHPQFMEERFQQTSDELHAFMVSVGYDSELLVEDHEQHFRFFPRETA